ncbi:acyl-CoA dehydrogenase family protein [Salinicola salarius]|uniref:acyl-CoA dehydrogenase family protein n=1 Tax=Salinicola salarius TaxID=430457 RepID=UPI0023E43909|nr:acyl-CoA dehydrogenase family protein [Salinicola salarius]MDF3918187.1 acyl-CoA dehydrogenase family protein [Salinicola salarius]
MNFELDNDQQAYREAARRFSRQELAPNAAEWDANGLFPVETLRRAGDMGFCGLCIPEAHGGLGLSRLDATLIIEELARGCTATTAFLTIHNMVNGILSRYATDAVREAWLPAMIAGDKLGSYCLTEPGAGSDAAALRTRARREGDGDHASYVIDGSKMFISGAGSTQLLVVMARTGEPGSGADGISAFAVPADSAGIEYGKSEDKMGWRSQPTRAISFDGVRVPADHRLGEEGEGFRIAMRALDGGRINIATCSVGTAQAALETAHRYLETREQFGRPLADFQALQFKLADMATQLVAARQMVRLAASKLDRDDPDAALYCAMSKRFATDEGFTICNDALQLHGGYGYLRDYPLERHVRDCRVHQILEGTNEIMRLVVARRLLAKDDLENLS